MRVEGSVTNRTPLSTELAAVVSTRRPTVRAVGQGPSVEAVTDVALPPVKVVVSMVEELTGRPVRLIDAADWTSLDLDSPPPERPAPLSSRPDWGVALGAMDRPSNLTSYSASTVTAAATVTTADGNHRELSVSISLSAAFVADQRARALDGRSPLADPLLISLGPTVPALRQGATSFELGLDLDADVARLAVAPELTRSNLDAEAGSDRAAVARALDPAAMKNVAALSAGSTSVSRRLIASGATPEFRMLDTERHEAIRLDIIA
jgi:hypothetical protein